MKNETASREIESLDYYLQNHTNDYSEESHMAMMMAIKALEQQPILDKIRAEIDEARFVDKDTKICRNALASGLEVAMQIIDKYLVKNAPSVQPKTRWIPVSERLPEDYGEYICTMSNDNVQECGFVPSGEKGLIPGWSTCEADGFKKLDYRDIKAWMPLPQPYKESEEEE